MKSVKIDGVVWKVGTYFDYFETPLVEFVDKTNNKLIQLDLGESCEFAEFTRFHRSRNGVNSYFVNINGMEFELQSKMRFPRIAWRLGWV